MPKKELQARMVMNVIIMALLFIASCGFAVSQTTKAHSKLDGTTEYRMEPAWACSLCSIKIGFYRTTRMRPDDVVMIVQVVSSRYGTNPAFASGKSLFFQVDDKIYSFKSRGSGNKEQSSSRYKHGTVDAQEYDITKEFLKTLINAKRVVVKVNLVGGEYVDGVFPDWGPTTIGAAITDFYEQAF